MAMYTHISPLGRESDLRTAKQPLGYCGGLIEPGTLMATYLSALENGSLDSELRLAPPTASIRERVDKLFLCLSKMKRGRYGMEATCSCPYDWFDEGCTHQAAGAGPRRQRPLLLHGSLCHGPRTSPPEYTASLCCARLFGKCFLFDNETFTLIQRQRVEYLPYMDSSETIDWDVFL